MHTSAGRRGIRVRLARAVGLGVGVAVVVTLIAFLVRSRFDPVLSLDERAIRAATDVTRAHSGLRRALIAWQEAFQPLWVYLVATAVCLWVWLRKGLRSRAWWAFATMMVGWNLALDIKYLVRRARPVVEDAVSHSPGYSFPSGHAANAAIAATALVVLLWPVVESRAGRTVLVAVAALAAVLTCLDRVYLGVHFPSDVTAGLFLGVGLVLSSYVGYLDWNPPSSEPAEDPDFHPRSS
jgi:undecaprenyl-diphosphatase